MLEIKSPGLATFCNAQHRSQVRIGVVNFCLQCFIRHHAIRIFEAAVVDKISAVALCSRIKGHFQAVEKAGFNQLGDAGMTGGDGGFRPGGTLEQGQRRAGKDVDLGIAEGERGRVPANDDLVLFIIAKSDGVDHSAGEMIDDQGTNGEGVQQDGRASEKGLVQERAAAGVAPAMGVEQVLLGLFSAEDVQGRAGVESIFAATLAVDFGQDHQFQMVVGMAVGDENDEWFIPETVIAAIRQAFHRAQAAVKEDILADDAIFEVAQQSGGLPALCLSNPPFFDPVSVVLVNLAINGLTAHLGSMGNRVATAT